MGRHGDDTGRIGLGALEDNLCRLANLVDVTHLR
jgi:hypothetical protein